MAKGYPDFFGYSVFPAYGTLDFTDDGPTTFANSTVYPSVIVGKGLLYGGFLKIALETNDPGSAWPAIIIDSYGPVLWTIEEEMKWGYDVEGYSLIQLVGYNMETFTYNYAVKGNITFSTGISLGAGGGVAVGDITVESQLIWSQIISG